MLQKSRFLIVVGIFLSVCLSLATLAKAETEPSPALRQNNFKRIPDIKEPQDSAKGPSIFVPGEVIITLANGDAATLQQPNDESLKKAYEQYGTPVVSRLNSQLDKFGETPAAWQESLAKKFPARAARFSGGTIPEGLNRLYRLRFDPKRASDLAALIAALKQSPLVSAVSANYGYVAHSVPNDPYYAATGDWGQTYPDLWNLQNSKMEGAWSVTTGSANVTIAVLDTGLDLTHLDISGNVYSNGSEALGTSGVDDDGNGWVDDVNGYDVINGDKDPTDDEGHGTHVAGIVAATGNNAKGVTGTMWSGRIMPVKVMDSYGNATTSSLEEGILYATLSGADVISISLGSVDEFYDVNVSAVIALAQSFGVLVVTSAGNDFSDSTAYFPTGYDSVLSVASSAFDDSVTSFSNYGPRTDVAAPGGEAYPSTNWILSLLATGINPCADSGIALADCFYAIDTNYRLEMGTSMSTPLVAGLAGLLINHDPTLTTYELQQAIRMSADDIGDAGWDTRAGYGRVNAENALALTEHCEANISNPTDYEINRTAPVTIYGTAGGNDFNNYTLKVGSGFQPTSYSTIGTGTSGVRNANIGNFTPSGYAGTYTVHLQVYATSGNLCGEDREVFYYSDLHSAAQVTAQPNNVLDSANLGYAITSGDINNDGYDDLLMGAPNCWDSSSSYFSGYACLNYDSYWEFASKAYVLWGQPTISGTYPVRDTVSIPVSWASTQIEDRMGVSVALADIDKDGYDDVLLGRPGANKISVFLGKKSGTWGRDMDPATANFTIAGEATDDALGYYLVNAGDLDHDGFDDVATSACGNDSAGTDFGKAYVIYSSSNKAGWRLMQSLYGEVKVANAAATKITGVVDTFFCQHYAYGRGFPVASAGDFNGDGTDDLLVGSPQYNHGFVAVFPGVSGGKIASGSITSAPIQFYYNGSDYDGLGWTVAPAGDVNNDGFDDFITASAGQKKADGYYYFQSNDFIVYGGNAFGPSEDVTTLGAPILGDYSLSQFGDVAAKGVGDINTDGIDDIMIGVPLDHRSGLEYYAGDPLNSGQAYAFTGSRTGIRSGITAYDNDAVFKNEDFDGTGFGYAVTSGDYNGDGKRDVAIGAPSHIYDTYASVYIYLGNLLKRGSDLNNIELQQSPPQKQQEFLPENTK